MQKSFVQFDSRIKYFGTGIKPINLIKSYWPHKRIVVFSLSLSSHSIFSRRDRGMQTDTSSVSSTKLSDFSSSCMSKKKNHTTIEWKKKSILKFKSCCEKILSKNMPLFVRFLFMPLTSMLTLVVFSFFFFFYIFFSPFGSVSSSLRRFHQTKRIKTVRESVVLGECLTLVKLITRNVLACVKVWCRQLAAWTDRKRHRYNV